jgi:hypothetical protein
MYDLSQPNDFIAQMRDGKMSDEDIIRVCTRVIAMLQGSAD